MSYKKFTILYFIVLFVTIALSIYGSSLEAITKPLVTLSLMYWLIKNRLLVANKNIFFTSLLALICSLIGDELLVFDSYHPMLFIAGLISFLVAHIAYSKTLSNHRNHQLNFFNSFMISLSLVGLVIALLLNYHLENQLKIPVFLYIIVILTMANYAYLRKNVIDPFHWRLGVLGAISFVISDLLLAINAFITPLYAANFLVMSTYGIAQFLLIKSIISAHDH